MMNIFFSQPVDLFFTICILNRVLSILRINSLKGAKNKIV
jgi:hypothetical protein